VFQDYECELHHQEDDIPYSRELLNFYLFTFMLIHIQEYINKQERENFSRMHKLMEHRKEKYLERQTAVDTDEEVQSEEENKAIRGDEPKHFKRLKPKGLTLEKVIEDLNKEDKEEPTNVPRNGSYVSTVACFYFYVFLQIYYKEIIDDFKTKSDDNDMMFSHHFTTKCAVQFIVVYGDLKGLLCFKRKGKIGNKDITNLVIVKNAELSEKEGLLKAE
jgi:hypothetical protein